MTATVNAPAGIQPTAWLTSAKLGTWGTFPLETRASGLNTSFVVPMFPGATYSVLALANGAHGSSVGWSVGASAGATTTPTLTAPPAWVAPADGATDITTATKFEVSNPSGAPVTVVCSPDDANPSFAVSTVQTGVTLPNVVGMPLPSAAKYACQILSRVGRRRNRRRRDGQWPRHVGRCFPCDTGSGRGGANAATNGWLSSSAEKRTVTTK